MSSQDSDQSPLLKVATPELYRRNAFRLTGLPVTASAREVAKQADKLKMLAELGGQAAQQLTIIKGEEPPTLEEVREAMQRLKNVEARAIDEFFWFWPENWEKPEEDEACKALKRNELDGANTIWHQRREQGNSMVAWHNLAILYHMRALQWASADFVTPSLAIDKKNEQNMWQYALDFWKKIGENETFWNIFKARIRQLGDAALTTGFARRLRAELPQALDHINAELALTYVSQGRTPEAEWHLQFLKSTQRGNDNLTVIQDSVLTPPRRKLSNLIEAAQKATSQNKLKGLEQAMHLLGSAKPLLAVFEIFLKKENLERCHIFDEVAGTALSIAIVGYNTILDTLKDAGTPKAFEPNRKAKAAESFIALLMRTRQIATDHDLQIRIDLNLDTARENLRFETKIQPFIARLRSLNDSPPQQRMALIKGEVLAEVDLLLSSKILQGSEADDLCDAVAGALRGLGIVAHNDENDILLAIEASELAAKYARDPELIARIKQDRETLKTNALARGFTLPRVSSPHYEIPTLPTKAKVPTAPQTTTGSGTGWLWAVGVVILIILIVSSQTDKPSSSTTRYSVPPTKPPPQVTYTAPPAPMPYKKPAPIPTPVTQYTPPLTSTSPVVTPLPPPRLFNPNEWHKWTNKDGRQIQAKFVSYDGENVIIIKDDGKTYTYPINNLNWDSQKLARQLEKDRH